MTKITLGSGFVLEFRAPLAARVVDLLNNIHREDDRMNVEVSNEIIARICDAASYHEAEDYVKSDLCVWNAEQVWNKYVFNNVARA